MTQRSKENFTKEDLWKKVRGLNRLPFNRQEVEKY